MSVNTMVKLFNLVVLCLCLVTVVALEDGNRIGVSRELGEFDTRRSVFGDATGVPLTFFIFQMLQSIPNHTQSLPQMAEVGKVALALASQEVMVLKGQAVAAALVPMEQAVVATLAQMKPVKVVAALVVVAAQGGQAVALVVVAAQVALVVVTALVCQVVAPTRQAMVAALVGLGLVVEIALVGLGQEVRQVKAMGRVAIATLVVQAAALVVQMVAAALVGQAAQVVAVPEETRIVVVMVELLPRRTSPRLHPHTSHMREFLVSLRLPW